MKSRKLEKLPLYLQVKDLLLDDIQKGEFPPGGFMPPEREIADAFDVSRMTVRKALEELENAGFLTSLQNRRGYQIAAMQDEPEIIGGHENTLGFLFRWGAEVLYGAHYYAPIYEAVEKRAMGDGRRVCLVTGQMSRDHLDSKWLLSHFGGVFVTDGMDPEVVSSLLQDDLPVVLVNCSVKAGEKANSVVVDNVKAAREATRHLIELGHERIGFLSEHANSGETEVFKERLKGWRSALEGAFITPNDSWIRKSKMETNQLFSTIGGYRGMKELLSTDPYPTAVFACNDLIAIGAIEAAREAGLEVPDDISIIGFDDIEDAARADPPLTTMRVDLEEMGEKAYQKLVSLIETDEHQGHEEIKVSTELIERESTKEAPTGASVLQRNGITV